MRRPYYSASSATIYCLPKLLLRSTEELLTPENRQKSLGNDG
ncbi:hypothetical protein [Prevotella histicola]